MKDYYQILEVGTDASQDIIKEQYRFLVQAWHPDKFPNPSQKLRAEEKLKEINAAYEILRNPAKRAEYDNSRSRYTRSSHEQEYREPTNKRQSEDERRKQEEAVRHAKEEQLRKERADRERANKERAEAEKRRQEQSEDEKRRAVYERALIGKWQRIRIEERKGKGFLIRFLLGKIFGVNPLTFKEDKTFIGEYPFPSRMLYPGTYKFIDQTHILLIPNLEEKEIEMELVNDELNVNKHYFKRIQ